MSMIDYGALLRVDGKFINRNQMFMDSSDTGFMYDEVLYDGDKMNINGDFFVYAGDEEFMIVFYKRIFHIISHGKVIKTVFNDPFESEKFFFVDLPDVTVKHLDTDRTVSMWFNLYDTDYDKDFLRRRYGRKEALKIIFRNCKRNNRLAKSISNYYMTSRWLVTWEHNGHKYEVIFGYGIEPTEVVWNEIKNGYYDFTETEQKLIDSWFEGE